MKKTAAEQFKILAPFEVKAATTPPHNPEMSDTGDEEVIKVAGYANFSGVVEEGSLFVDLVGDVVVPSGIDVSVWKKNPQILLHHRRDCTIGRGISVVKKKDGLFIEAEIHKGAMEEEDFYRIKSGLLAYFSIGFRVLKGEWKKVGDTEAYFITKSLLMETSIVGLPCNTESAFQLVKSIPGGDGIYAGELSDTKNFSEADENDSQIQEGDTMKVKLADLLSAEDCEKFKSLGLEAKLDEIEEIDVKTYIDKLVATKAAELKAEIMTEIAAEKEAAAKEQEAEETKTDEGETPAEADDEGTKESTEEETKEDDELDEETLKALAAAVETLKTIV